MTFYLTWLARKKCRSFQICRHDNHASKNYDGARSRAFPITPSFPALQSKLFHPLTEQEGEQRWAWRNELPRFGPRMPLEEVSIANTLNLPPSLRKMAPRLPPSKDEMALFLWDKFHIRVTNSSLKWALASVGWSKKVARQRAKKQNTDLRDFYLHNLSDFQSHHLVYVDESGCDKRIGFRRTGWSPVGTTPLQVSKFHRNQHCQILPTYAQDGVIFSQVFQGSTNTAVFVDFIKHLLKYCGKWPEPKSVLVIDNTSFHHSERIKEPYSNAGVKLVYLPPYSPNLNPIKELFSKLKAFIRQN